MCRYRPNTLMHQLSKLQLQAGHTLSAGLHNGGQALVVDARDGADRRLSISFDLRVSRGISPAALRNARSYPGLRTDGDTPVVPKSLPRTRGPPVIHRRRE